MRFAGHLICLGFFLIIQEISAQPEVCKKANEIISVINKHHVQPIPVNDVWSKRVFENFLASLDPEGLLFSQEDIQTLRPFETQLDNLVTQNQSCDWLSTVSKLYSKKIQDYKSWLDQCLSKPIDFKTPETFDQISLGSEIFTENAQALETRKRLNLKYDVLMRMYQESIMETPQRPLLTYEPLARQKIKNHQLKDLQHEIDQSGSIDKFLADCFYESIATAYDPHTAYFSYDDGEDFKSQLSPTQLSFGFSLTENHVGSVILSSIIPGGPAWASNELNDGDILLSVETNGNKSINSMDYSVEEIVTMLDAHSVLNAVISVKKPDGQIKKVSLTKTKLESIENVVNGFMLKGERNIGYIPLPSFYFDWNDATDASKGCAADVAKTIIKFNKEKLDGLIIDLRLNGGGSIQEALELAGIFIDYGPLIFYQETGKPVEVIKDMNKGTIYNGPLIIMVNGLSASASELFTSTLQDYNRALVVGANTFGKGTGQEILPTKGILTENSKSDLVKITSSKIYRLTGKTYQHKGVQPSITFPELTDSFSDRESDYYYALPSDSILKKAYYTPLPSIPVTSLSEKSKARISQSEAFKGLESLRTALSQPVPLNPEGFSKYIQQVTSYRPAVQGKVYTVTSTKFDNSLLTVDGFKKEQNEKQLKEIENSFYIQEAYFIMLDYITLSKK